MSTQARVREPSRIITAHHQAEGAGFIVRRPLPTASLDQVDPFLLIDEMGPIDYAPGKAVGAPDQPHRGFETVTYLLAGEVEHEDSAGNRGTLSAGDVQWMTAGGGIIHSEEPSARVRREGGRVHGFQIWVNLPKRLKMTQPRYQELSAAAIPKATSPDGLARVTVIAGEAFGVASVVDTHTPIVYQDWTLSAGADVTLPSTPGDTALVYVFDGTAQVGDAARPLVAGQMAILGDGDAIRLRGPAAGEPSARLLLLGGTPHREPMVRYGPFVMTTRDEIVQAVEDYQSGRMGEIVRTAQVVRRDAAMS